MMGRRWKMPRVMETEQYWLAAHENTNMYITNAFNDDVGTQDSLVNFVRENICCKQRVITEYMRWEGSANNKIMWMLSCDDSTMLHSCLLSF